MCWQRKMCLRNGRWCKSLLYLVHTHLSDTHTHTFGHARTCHTPPHAVPFCSWWYVCWCAPPALHTWRWSGPAGSRGWRHSWSSVYCTSEPECHHYAPAPPGSDRVEGQRLERRRLTLLHVTYKGKWSYPIFKKVQYSEIAPLFPGCKNSNNSQIFSLCEKNYLCIV